jgi:hypothetical protein
MVIPMSEGIDRDTRVLSRLVAENAAAMGPVRRPMPRPWVVSESEGRTA